MTAMDLLLWARGPGLGIAIAIFLFGMTLRLFEIYSLGRKRDLSTPRSHTPGSGWRTIVSRSLPHADTWRRSALTIVAGFAFHIGLFIVLLFLLPHIELIRSLTGLSWPALPTPLVDLATVITLIALIVLLVHRLMDPVKRFLSGFGDYLAWTVTFLPLLTGYMAYHHLLFDYTLLLALHILSAELLLVVFPFTKLTHTFTLFIARWYNGDIAAHKGVAS
jgi:nitrate reductase gamma subunit